MVSVTTPEMPQPVGTRPLAAPHKDVYTHTHFTHTWHRFWSPGSLAVPQSCRVLFQICHRDDALPLAHVAIAVEGPGWANPDNVALQVANAMLGHYDCTYGGSTVSARVGMDLAFRKEFWDFVLVLWDAGCGLWSEAGC